MNALDQSIIEALQTSLKLHWTAIATYSAQAAHFGRWGYSKLSSAAMDDVKEEQEHAARLMNRLEVFDVVSQNELANPVDFPRHDYAGILAANLLLESASATAERAAILTARQFGDEITAGVFAENLDGSEDSIIQIEAEQKVISQIGIDNYLANKV